MNKSIFYIFTTDGTSALLYRVQEGSTSHQHDDKRFRQALLPYQARSATRYHVYHHQHGRRSVNHFRNATFLWLYHSG